MESLNQTESIESINLHNERIKLAAQYLLDLLNWDEQSPNIIRSEE
ncbi:MAG: hypothetical protein WCJ60_00520 [bacterium]